MATPLGQGTIAAPFVSAASSLNYGDRRNVGVDTLVLHVTQDTRNAAELVARAPPSAVPWFANPAAKASAHYVVGREGLIWACVPEGLCAWHAGNAATNRRSIGIEIEGLVDRRETFNPEAMAALVGLAAAIVKRHRIPVLRQPGPGICGHCDVPDPTNPNERGGKGHHTDPGPLFPWDHFFAALRAEIATTSQPPPAAGT